ncbi:hypothetical protein D1BOALGB6SA_8638 [Olavius sp. associated proteobacterium Delta 1]|nr:hypothetical protein D1BOALGB6SA_8638 [Olavius sp. associated proteobacterium Delta 1]
MFGLTGSEGNHGEDAKEYWFYLDSTPTHSYMKVRSLVGLMPLLAVETLEYELLENLPVFKWRLNWFFENHLYLPDGGNSNWRDLILFNEYFNGDNGAGLGSAHQTGWTGLVAKVIQQSGGGKTTA